MSVSKLFDEFQTEQVSMGMLTNSVKKRIQKPLMQIRETSASLSENHLGIYALYLYLKALISSDNGEFDQENIDAFDLLQTVYNVLNKNYADFRNKFILIQN